MSYCKSCQAVVNKQWRLENREKRKTYEKAYKTSNKTLVKKQKSLWDKRNAEWRKTYRKLNTGKYNSYAMKRYVREKLAQPTGLSDKYLRELESFYWMAKDLKAVTGETYHVDHIVPLQGKNVCGLHVSWNLQILPADLNMSKSNTFEEDKL
jgi:hypothetical protein